MASKWSEQDVDDYMIITGRGKKLVAFEQHQRKSEMVTDDLPVSVICFNVSSLCILTVTERSVKIWDAVHGGTKRVFYNVTDTDISAVCLDDRERKFITGTVGGKVEVFNLSNGAKMKQINTLLGPIVELHYCNAEKVLVVASSDGEIKCFDEERPERLVLMSSFHDGQATFTDDLTNMAASYTLGLVASCSRVLEDGVFIWSFAAGKVEHKLLAAMSDSYHVSSLAFLAPYPLLACGCSDGMVRVWLVHPHPHKGLCILTAPNISPIEANYDGEKAEEYPLLHLARAATHRFSEGKEQSDQEDQLQSNQEQEEQHEEAGGNEELAGEGEQDYTDWRTVPRAVSVVPLQVLSLAWQAEDCALHTGDESGRLRRWSLGGLISKIGLQEVQPPEDGSVLRSPLGRCSQQSGLHKLASRHTSINDGMELDRKVQSSLLRMDFVWGIEGAHDDAIGLLKVAALDPPAILSGSTDRCVKMWNTDGRSQGILLQGFGYNQVNPKWSLKFNAAARAQQEMQELTEVVEGLEASRAGNGMGATADSSLGSIPPAQRPVTSSAGKGSSFLPIIKGGTLSTGSPEEELFEGSSSAADEESSSGMTSQRTGAHGKRVISVVPPQPTRRDVQGQAGREGKVLQSIEGLTKLLEKAESQAEARNRFRTERVSIKAFIKKKAAAEQESSSRGSSLHKTIVP
ncbi:unnamed protein product [Chrysoparadoxa australica]